MEVFIMRDRSKDLFAKASVLYDEAKTILKQDEISGEDEERVENLINEADALKSRAVRMGELEKASEDVLTRIEREMNAEGDKEIEPREDLTEFKDFGDFLQAAWKGLNPRYNFEKDPRLQRFKEREPGLEKKDMAGNVGASGGFLIPVEMIMSLYSVAPEDAIVQPRATVIPMNRRQVQIPVLDQTGTTANVPHWFGGLTFYYAEEGSAKTESDAEFRQINLVAKKLIGYTRSSDELVEDSAISLGAFFNSRMGFIGGAIWHRDYQFLRGTGAGAPLGVINAGATISVPRTATNPAIQYEDLVDMVEAFLPTGRGVWVANQTALSNLMLMQDQGGGAANTGGYIWGNAAAGVPASLLGLPIIFTEKLPTVGTAGDILLADFNYYLVGDRKAATVESTQYDRWRYDQTSWRMVDRHDGQPWLSAPLTLQDGTTQISPFVILGDKST
jgi:HK97 family phage major capsid protein